MSQTNWKPVICLDNDWIPSGFESGKIYYYDYGVYGNVLVRNENITQLFTHLEFDFSFSDLKQYRNEKIRLILDE